VRGEEASARKGGFGDEKRDEWRLRCCHSCCWRECSCARSGGGSGRVAGVTGRAEEVGGVSEEDALELAQVGGAYLLLLGFALREDAQSASVVRGVRGAPGRLCRRVERTCKRARDGRRSGWDVR
jgi:hypothetical protein